MRAAIPLLCLAALLPDASAAQRGSARLTREIAIADDALPNGFTRVGGVVVGPQKQLFVEQPQDNIILMFDSTGKYIRSIGGKGQGPGETENLGGIGLVGDSLWTYDWRARRFAFFAPDGNYRSTVSPPAFIDSTNRGAGVRISASTPLANGDFFFGAFSYSSFTELKLLAPVPQFIGTREGKKGRTVALTDSLGRGSYGVQYDRGAMFTSDPFFGSLVNMNTLVSIGGAGSWFAVALRGDCSKKPRYTVARTSLSGDTLWKTTVECPRVAVPSGFIDSIVTVNRDRVLKNRQLSPSYVEGQIRGKLRMSGFTPARGLFVGNDGSIWIRPFTALGDTVETWLRADPRQGSPNQITLPPRAQLKAIVDPTRIWVTQYDDDDLPTLVRYRMTEPAGR